MNRSILTLLASLSLGICAGHANQISESQLKWVDFYKKQKSIVPAAEAQINTDPEPALDAPGFVNLYNGKNLDGWTPLGGKCTFEAQGEVIVGTCVPGTASTYLSTERTDYSDFIFTAELKWIVDGNTGVMFRAQSKEGKKGASVFGPQCEMEAFSKQRFWSGGIYGQGVGGWRYPLWLDAHSEAREAVEEGQWNRITIQAIGDTVKTWVNGIPAAHWIDSQYKQGYFGLQIHKGSEGTIHFRNIKVKELTEATGAAPETTAATENWTDLFASGDFSNWQNIKGKAISKGWSIDEQGVVHRSGIKPGSIATKKDYTDFELTFDWKISEAGNSGIKYRTRGSLGPEYQILDDEKHKDGAIPSHRAASLYELATAPDSKPINPVGEWNRGRIKAEGKRLQHWLNGEKVVDIEYGSSEWVKKFEASKYKKHEGFGSWTGPIQLQDHADEVWFRNLKIREL